MPNFSRTQILIFIIAILLLVNIAMVVSFGMKQPQPKENERPRRANPIASTLKEKIGFSDEQMQKIEQLKKQHRETMHTLFEDIKNAKIAFYKNVNKAEIADSTLERLSNNIGRKQQAIDLQAFRNFREIRSLCTPEQLPAYDSLMPGVIQNMWFPDKHRDMNRRKDSSNEKNNH